MIRIEDLEFQWPGSKAPLLRLPRFELKPGEKVFVHGRSGSGKSTLLNLLTGILPINQGQIHLLDQPFSEQSSRSQDRFRADHIGLIFQQFNLVPYLTALENVELPLRFSKRRQNKADLPASELLQLMGLPTEAIHRKPEDLSIGQQQRVAAARALIGQPELIFADEPTSALDSHSAQQFLAPLFEQSQKNGTGILFVSHDRALEKYFDRSFDLEEANQ